MVIVISFVCVKMFLYGLCNIEEDKDIVKFVVFDIVEKFFDCVKDIVIVVIVLVLCFKVEKDEIVMVRCLVIEVVEVVKVLLE